MISQTPMLAYHSDTNIKRKYLARVRAHAKADELLQGYGYWKNGKGCAVGCTIHGDSHEVYEIELGIPAEIAYLEDHFFERLEQQTARVWPARFLAAIKPGADLSRIYDQWSAWNLIDPVDGVITLVTNDYPDVQRIVRETGEACLNGDRVNAARAARAARAAEAARAAWAARAAAGAARAAEAAAGAAWAAGAAEAARAAAWAAEAAAGAAWAAGAAEAAAGAAYYIRASDKLIALLEAAA